MNRPRALWPYHQFTAACSTPPKIGRFAVAKMIGNQTIAASTYQTLT